MVLQGSKVMRQRRAETLVTEEPDEGNLHVRTCGGTGWVTAGSTRNIIHMGAHGFDKLWKVLIINFFNQAQEQCQI